MKKFIALVGLLASLFFISESYAATNSVNSIGNIWNNASPSTPAAGTCVVSTDDVNVNYFTRLTIYAEMDSSPFAGTLRLDWSPDGTNWYSVLSTEPGIAYTYSTSDGTRIHYVIWFPENLVEKKVRVRQCDTDTFSHITVSVFAK